jgi:hypothetical protein
MSLFSSGKSGDSWASFGIRTIKFFTVWGTLNILSLKMSVAIFCKSEF